MSADPYHLDRVRTRARSGYEDAGSLEELITAMASDEFPDDEEAVAELRALAEEELAALAAREQTWTEATMNDRIAAAFADLNARGIIALQDAGYTQSDGWEDANELSDERENPRGATFFHGQDVERAVEGGGLMLTFGPYGASDAEHEAASLALARDIVATLEKFGVPTQWDGTIGKRIEIPPFEWQQRLTTSAPRRGSHITAG